MSNIEAGHRNEAVWGRSANDGREALHPHIHPPTVVSLEAHGSFQANRLAGNIADIEGGLEASITPAGDCKPP